MRGALHLDAHITRAAKVDGPHYEHQQNRSHKGQLDEGCAMIGVAEDA
jgi:hypothetical protein